MLSKLQWRCLLTFCLPLLFLVIFFLLNYFLIFYHFLTMDSEVIVFSALAVTGMEILWGYFPIIGGYIFLSNRKERNVDRDVAQLAQIWLAPREERFFFLMLPALVGLCFITATKVYLRFNCPDCFSFWFMTLLLELNWLYLQGISIYCWKADCWNDETEKAINNGKRFSTRQKRCIVGFTLPFVILVVLVAISRILEWTGSTAHHLAMLSFLIDLLFIVGNGMSTYSWIADNWRIEMKEGQRFQRFQRFSRRQK